MAGITENVKEMLNTVAEKSTEFKDYTTGAELQTSDTHDMAVDAKAKASDMADAAKDKASDLASAASDKASELKDAASDKASEMYEGAKQKASDLVGAAKVKADENTSEETKKKLEIWLIQLDQSLKKRDTKFVNNKMPFKSYPPNFKCHIISFNFFKKKL
uniref:Late embryogenesis abundant protein n=1 Tax=Panagrolaimus superbus TaxID=310955 RepID=A0A914YCC4_9BILA